MREWGYYGGNKEIVNHTVWAQYEEGYNAD
jgi:hypothetical protein